MRPIHRGLITLAALFVTSAAIAQPKIELSKMNWDFGTVWHGEKPTYTLVVKNIGNEDLHISRVQPSCGCTAMQPAKYDLKPGEATEVVATYDSHGKQGKQTSSVTIFSNDPVTPEIKFDIKGEVKRAVTMEPMGGLVIRATDPTKVLEGKVKLINHEPMPFKIEVGGIDQATKFEIVVKETDPGKEVEIYAKTKPPFDYGTTSSTLTVKTGLQREPVITVPVQARISERVSLAPGALLFIKEDTKPAKRGIELHYFGTDENFQVTGVCSKNPKFRATVGPKQPPPEWMKNLPPTPKFVFTINMEIPPGPEIPDEGAVFDITTNDPEFPLVQAVCTTKKEVFQAITYRSGPAPKATPTCAPEPVRATAAAPAPVQVITQTPTGGGAAAPAATPTKPEPAPAAGSTPPAEPAGGKTPAAATPPASQPAGK